MTVVAWYTHLVLTQPRTAAAVEALTAVVAIYALAWAASRLLVSAPAAIRHAMWATATAGALVIPLLHLDQLLGGSLVVGATWTAGPDVDGQAFLPMLASVWVVGTVVLLVRTLVGWLRARGIVRRARPPHPAQVRLPEYVPPRTVCLLSDELNTPFTFGVLRPRIVLPTSAIGSGREQLSAVLIHEGAHVRRRDVLTLYLGLLARALYWPIPMSWTALRYVREESEFACDAAVLAAGVRRSVYARQLERFSVSSAGILVAGVPTLGSQVFRRIQSLCSPEPPRVANLGAVAATVLASLIVVALVGRLEIPTAELGFVSEDGTEWLSTEEAGGSSRLPGSWRLPRP